MKTIQHLRPTMIASIVAHLLGTWAGGAQAAFEGTSNTFYGISAGPSTAGDNDAATFVGAYAGFSNTTGNMNTFLGRDAGLINTAGNRNVFLGYGAGLNETGSNKLYIDNCFGGVCTSPLIYGEFDNHLLKINGVVNVAANGVAKSQLHFSQSGADVGGWLTTVLDNNFFVSSGAMYDGSLGGWIQKSPDGNAVMAGSDGVGYRVLTHTGGVVGTSFTPTARLHIDYRSEERRVGKEC